MPVEQQVVSIFAGTKGYLDDVATTDVVRFERELLDFVQTRHSGLLADLRTGGIPDGLAEAVEAFKAQFEGGGDGAYSVDPASVDADELGEAASPKTLATE
jgi:F-type H+-transporting ATPase subunit alpha